MPVGTELLSDGENTLGMDGGAGMVHNTVSVLSANQQYTSMAVEGFHYARFTTAN